MSGFKISRSSVSMVAEVNIHGLYIEALDIELSTCSRRAAALQSSFLAAMCKAGSRTLPRVSFSRSTATTLSWPCCIATARGVNPSCNNIHTKYSLKHQDDILYFFHSTFYSKHNICRKPALLHSSS